MEPLLKPTSKASTHRDRRSLETCAKNHRRQFPVSGSSPNMGITKKRPQPTSSKKDVECKSRQNLVIVDQYTKRFKAEKTFAFLIITPQTIGETCHRRLYCTTRLYNANAIPLLVWFHAGGADFQVSSSVTRLHYSGGPNLELCVGMYV